MQEMNSANNPKEYGSGCFPSWALDKDGSNGFIDFSMAQRI